VQFFLGAVLVSTDLCPCFAVRPDVVALHVTTVPLGAVVDQTAVGAARVPAASSPAAA